MTDVGACCCVRENFSIKKQSPSVLGCLCATKLVAKSAFRTALPALVCADLLPDRDRNGCRVNLMFLGLESGLQSC